MTDVSDRDQDLLFSRVRETTRRASAHLHEIARQLPSKVTDDLPQLQADLDRAVDELDCPLVVAVAGEFSVGKSTLICALTGETLEIGAGVTTDAVSPHEYRDVRLIDMPGTLSGGLTHDNKAMQAIVDSDLLLFVVSNELLNAGSLPYFRKALEAFHKREQCMLVVNQFDRVNLHHRTPEDAIRVMTEALNVHTSPDPIEKFSPVFVSARDYLEACSETDPAERQCLLEESRFHTLVAALDQFCIERGPAGKLARPLQVLNKVAWDMLEALSSENADDATVTAYLRRRKRIFIEEQFDLRRRLVNLRNERCANVRALAEPIVTAIEQRLAVDAVNDAYSHADGEFARLQDCTADEMLEIIRKSLDAINERLLELDASPLGSSFRDSLERISLASATMQFGKSGSPFTDKALRHGTDLLSKSGRDLAKNAGKYAQQATETLKGLFNIKFKPYGKIKLTGSLEKLIGGIGKAVPWIMIGVDLYLNYRDEKDREKAERERQEFRAQVRGAFRDAATSFGDALDASSSTVVAELVDTPLAEVAAEEHALLTANETTSSLKRQLVELQEELTQHLEGIRAS